MKLLFSLAFLLSLCGSTHGQFTKDQVTPQNPTLQQSIALALQPANHVQFDNPYLPASFKIVRATTSPVLGDVSWGNRFISLKSKATPCGPNQLNCAYTRTAPKPYIFDVVRPGFQRKQEETPITHQRKTTWKFSLSIER